MNLLSLCVVGIPTVVLNNVHLLVLVCSFGGAAVTGNPNKIVIITGNPIPFSIKG